MKRYLILFSLSLLSSCCDNRVCCEPDPGLGIQLRGFDKTDLDTIYTTGYALGSNFSVVTVPQRKDTARSDGATSSPNIYLTGRKNESLTPIYEWKIVIPGANKTIFIGNYSYTTYECNKCFLKKAPTSATLSGATVNGVQTGINPIRIDK